MSVATPPITASLPVGGLLSPGSQHPPPPGVVVGSPIAAVASEATLQQKFWYQDWDDQAHIQELLATMSDEDKSYQQALYEILSTEQDYLRNLETIHEIFIVPMAERGLNSDEKVKELFGTLIKLIPLAKNVISELKKCRFKSPLMVGVGDMFTLESESFRGPYSEYFKGYTKALENLQQRKKKDSQLSSFLKEVSTNPKLRKISLDGYLLTPVQRVMKYPVLLDAVLKYCPPTNPEHASLKQARQVISKVVSSLNEEKRRMENIEKIQEVAQTLNFHTVSPPPPQTSHP